MFCYEERFMKQAIRLAKENVEIGNGGPFGCVIVKNDRIIASGVNSVIAKNDPSAHAEITAIRNACKELDYYQIEDCVIYSSCEPCPMCLGAIYWARPKKVYFAASKQDAENAGFDDSFIYKEINLPPENRSIKMKQKNQDDAVEIFKIWNKSELKIKY